MHLPNPLEAMWGKTERTEEIAFEPWCDQVRGENKAYISNQQLAGLYKDNWDAAALQELFLRHGMFQDPRDYLAVELPKKRNGGYQRVEYDSAHVQRRMIAAILAEYAKLVGKNLTAQARQDLEGWKAWVERIENRG